MINLVTVLHIVSFGFAMALTTGVSILLQAVAAKADARTIHKVFSAAVPMTMVGGTLWLVTGVLGFWLASLYGHSLTAPWLIGAYVAYAVLMVVGFGGHTPWNKKVVALSAADAAAGETVSPALQAHLHAPAEKIFGLLSALSLLALLYLMVFKPS